jgi:hypothetical protein
MLVASAMLLLGCQSQDKPEQAERDQFEEFWAPDDRSRSVWAILDRQAAAGAREDAALGAQHFDGDALNSLGTARLELLVAGPTRPTTVYLNLPDKDENSAARRESVNRWLQEAGLASDAVVLKDGPNPSMSRPAAPELSRLWKTESPGPVASGSNEETGANVGGGMPGSGGAPAGGAAP